MNQSLISPIANEVKQQIKQNIQQALNDHQQQVIVERTRIFNLIAEAQTKNEKKIIMSNILNENNDFLIESGWIVFKQNARKFHPNSPTRYRITISWDLTDLNKL